MIALSPEATVPRPVPILLAERVKTCRVKVAVTERAALIVTVQAPVPVHAPLQPLKIDPDAALARRVTGVPLS